MDNSKYNSPRKNQGTGKQNPFTDELGVQKEGDSDQIQDSYHDTGSGWIPFMASNKKPIKFSLFDNTQVPGYKDRGESWGGDWNGMGNAPFRNNSDIATYEKFVSFPSREVKNIKRTNPEPDEENILNDINFITKSTPRTNIRKISANDDFWMRETASQISDAKSDFTDKLVEEFNRPWRYINPAKDGNTLMFNWLTVVGNNIVKFLLYIRYNAENDTYSASSSMYNGRYGQEKTLVGWIDNVSIEQIMNPQIWITGEKL